MCTISKKRHFTARTVVGGVFALSLLADVKADVFTSAQKPLSENTHALVDVLSESVVPGGIRSVRINGNDMRVRRYVNPKGDNSNFHTLWKAAGENKQTAIADILSVLENPDPLYQAATANLSSEHFEENLPTLMDASEAFIDSQSRQLEGLVKKAIETPFIYETQLFRAVARVPVKAIDNVSPLVSENSGNGYLFLAQKNTGTTDSNTFWHIQFSDNFSFSTLFPKKNKDANGEDAEVERYPGSIKKLVFTEQANGWQSTNWSYESSGDVFSHITHYLNAFKAQGYTKESKAVFDSDYALVQFAKSGEEATVFVEMLDARTQEVQITLQVRKN